MQRVHNILLYYLTIILRIMLYSKEKSFLLILNLHHWCSPSFKMKLKRGKESFTM